MSGGYFDYKEYHIGVIAAEIKYILDNFDFVEFEDLLDDKSKREEVLTKLKEGYEIMLKAKIYATRIDYWLEGDDSTNSFLQKLEDEIEETKRELI